MTDQERLAIINGKWGNYKIETSKGMLELCVDFEWLLEKVEKAEHYKKALEEIANGTHGDTPCNELAIKYQVVAEKALLVSECTSVFKKSSDVFWMESIGEEYEYIGKDSENNTNGKTYKVIGYGEYWFPEWGSGVWMTTNEDFNTTDEDYGCFFPYRDFRNKFKMKEQ